MATRYLGILATAQIRSPNRAEIVGAASGGTLAGAQSVQIVFDDTVFTSSAEGKQRLSNAVNSILDALSSGRTWPIDSTT